MIRKMKRKVIQLCYGKEVYFIENEKIELNVLYALCNDGSMWHRRESIKSDRLDWVECNWREITDIPQSKSK